MNGQIETSLNVLHIILRADEHGCYYYKSVKDIASCLNPLYRGIRIVVYACNLNPWQAEAGGFLRIPG